MLTPPLPRPLPPRNPVRPRACAGLPAGSSLALLLALHAVPVQAQQAAAPAPAASLAPLTNTATRSERRTDDVPATVSVLGTEEVENTGARDLKDLLRRQVDLSVRAAPTRFGAALGTTGRAGNEGINVRGLEGNQVLMLVDGIRVPGSFSFGAFATGRADYLALEATQAIEILRGPASAAFGSDGLAGALSLRTLDPADVLRPGQALGGFVRLGATQLDDSVVGTAAVATRHGAWQSLVLLSQRRGHETRNQGRNEALNSSRTAPNPLDYRQDVLLAKLQWQLLPAQRLGLTAEAVRRSAEIEVISGRAVPPAPPAVLPATAVVGLQARDRIERSRLSLDHLFDNPNGQYVQQAQTKLYVQQGRTRQFSAEDRFTAADRTRDNVYRERVLGLSTQLESTLATALPTRLTWGLDASRTELNALREGTPNPTAPPPFGETFPVKPFPDTEHRLAGAFVQGEIEVPGGLGTFVLLPGLRLDHYRLSPSTAGYTQPVVELSDQALTPRAGLIWRLSPAWAPYLQWSEGFRAPEPGQVNNGFTNVAAGYRSIGNSDLRPERARSVELGLRGQAGGWRWQFAAFDNRYRDFISQETVSGAGTPASPTIFQFVNLTRARIHGVEARAEWQIAPAWRLSLASAATRGNSERDGVEQPLNSIEPARTAMGLHYGSERWGWDAELLHAQAKSRSRIAAANPAPYAPPGYTVLDLAARWQPHPRWTLRAQLHNVGDETYTPWADVRGLAANSPVLDAYTAPGRHLQLSLRHDF